MRKLREVMRLRFELHLGYQQIGRSCAIGVSTVCKYLRRAEAVGLTWPLPEGPIKGNVKRHFSPPACGGGCFRAFSPQPQATLTL